MGARPPKTSSILIALAFALSVFGFTLFVWMSFGGTIPLKPKGYTFHAIFGAEAAQLTPNAQVRISGVPVGKVLSLQRSQRGTNALIQLERRFAPVEADAHAIIRNKTLLGETFIELTPGSPEGPSLPEGGTLPRSQIYPVSAVDEVLGAFDPPTRQALKVFLRDLSASLDGRGTDVNSALGNAPVTVAELTALVELLDRQEPAVRGLVRNGGVALRSLARREADLQSLIVEGDRLFAATAARDRSLAATVQELPGLLRELRTSVVELEATAIDARPTLRTLRPVAPLVRPALEGVYTLSPELERTFTQLDGVISNSKRGLEALTRIVDVAPPLVDQLHRAVPELIPVVHLLNRYRRDGIATLAKVAANANGRLERSDGSRPGYLRVLAPLSNELFLGHEHRLPTNRFNPYPQPTGVEEIESRGLEAFSCRQTGNEASLPPIGPGAPNCLVQGPWRLKGEARYYPRPEPYTYTDPD